MSTDAPLDADGRPLRPIRPPTGTGLIRRLLGSCVFVFGALLTVVGIGMTVAPTEDATPTDGIVVGGFALVFVVVGGLIWRSGRGDLRAARRYERVVTALRARPRAKVANLSAELGLEPGSLRELVEGAIGRRELDHVYSEAVGGYVARSELARFDGIPARCPQCNAPLQAMDVAAQGTLACPYCSTGLGLRGEVG